MPEEYPNEVVETPLGTAIIRPSGLDQVFFDAHGRDADIVIHNVPYKLSFRLVRNEAGELAWPMMNLGTADFPRLQPDYNNLYMKRADGVYQDPSTAAKDKVKAVLVPFVAEWANNHLENMRKAEEASRVTAIAFEHLEIAKAQKQISERLKKIEELEMAF